MEKAREDLYLAHGRLQSENPDAATDVNQALEKLTELQKRIAKQTINVLKWEQEKFRDGSQLSAEHKHMLSWGYAKRGECYRIISEKPIFFTPKISEHVLPMVCAGYNFHKAIQLRRGPYPWAETHGANVIVLMGLLDILFPSLLSDSGLLELWGKEIDSDAYLEMAENALEKTGYKDLSGSYTWAKIIYCLVRLLKIMQEVRLDRENSVKHLFDIAEILPMIIETVAENPKLYETSKDPFVGHANTLLFYAWIYRSLGSSRESCSHTQETRENFFNVINRLLTRSLVIDGYREEVIQEINLCRIYFFVYYRRD